MQLEEFTIRICLELLAANVISPADPECVQKILRCRQAFTELEKALKQIQQPVTERSNLPSE